MIKRNKLRPGAYDPEKGHDQLLSVAAAAAYMGVAVDSIKALMEVGRLPRVDLGQGSPILRVPLAAVREYMALAARAGACGQCCSPKVARVLLRARGAGVAGLLDTGALKDLRARSIRDYIWNETRKAVENKWWRWFEAHGVDLDRIDPEWRVLAARPDDGPDEEDEDGH